MLHQKIIFKKAIGKGGFGTVYLAEVENTQGFRKHIAIKQLNPRLATSKKALARQLAEARILGLLNHKNIVQVYDLGFLEGKLSICLEYIEGISLSELLEKTTVPLKVALEIIGECADALHSAYNTFHLLTKERLEVIHRDIKPANILISKTGYTKLLDFGIARGNYDRGMITSHQQIGTRRYMAPEQWLHNQVSEKVDIYALGFTFLELLYQSFLPRLALDAQLFHEQRRNLIEGLSFPVELQNNLSSLLFDMLSYNPLERPSALSVKQACFSLSEMLTGQTLRLFAQETISDLFHHQLESLSDLPVPDRPMTFTQLPTLHKEPPQIPQIPPPLPEKKRSYQGLLWLLPLFGSSLFFLNDKRSVSDSPSPPTIKSEPEKIDTVQQEAPIPFSEPEEPVKRVTQQKISTSAPSKKKSIPTKEPASFAVSFSSIPLGAQVYLDGKHLGKTMLLKVKIPEGQHQIKMVLGEKSIEKELTIQHSTRFVWTADKEGEQQWRSFLD